MSDSFRPDRAVRYACAVLADSGIGRLPVDPFRLAADVGITLVPLSAIRENPNWIPYNLPAALQMTRAVTLSYPTFCIVYRDEDSTPDQLRHVLCHELGHLFMNHYRDYPDRMEPGMPADNALEAEADSFARNLLAPVPVVDCPLWTSSASTGPARPALPCSGWTVRPGSTGWKPLTGTVPPWMRIWPTRCCSFSGITCWPAGALPAAKPSPMKRRQTDAPSAGQKGRTGSCNRYSVLYVQGINIPARG